MKIPHSIFASCLFLFLALSCSDSPTSSGGNYFYEISPPDPTIPYQLEIKVKNAIGMPMEGVGIHVLYNENNFIRSAKIQKPNPATTIRFGISVSGFVSVKVYRYGTKEWVATLVYDSLMSGMYSFIFDTSKLTNGVFVYTISTQENSTYKFMLLSYADMNSFSLKKPLAITKYDGTLSVPMAVFGSGLEFINTDENGNELSRKKISTKLNLVFTQYQQIIGQRAIELDTLQNQSLEFQF